jgi:hypothetical protein
VREKSGFEQPSAAPAPHLANGRDTPADGLIAEGYVIGSPSLCEPVTLPREKLAASSSRMAAGPGAGYAARRVGPRDNFWIGT